MFWDKGARLYDAFEAIYNKRVHKETGVKVAEFIGSDDEVLEEGVPRLIRTA